MCRQTVLSVLFAAAALIQAPAMAKAAPPTNVTVGYYHPDQFTETRKIREFAPVLADDDYLHTLKNYIADRASKIVPQGDHLYIQVTDIERAGTFEPWRGSSLRYVRIFSGRYPPRINLSFRLVDDGGKVVSEGMRKLQDPFFRADAASQSDIDDLRYEKVLIDRWLKKGPDQL